MKKILETKRTYLRKLTPDDYNNLCTIMQDEQTMYAYEGAFTDDEVTAWLDKQLKNYADYGYGLWAIIDRETEAFIGQAGLTLQYAGSEDQSEREIEVGYLLCREFWHMGYATEVARACKNYAFKVLHAIKVVSIIRDTNSASRAVAERNEMISESSFVKHYKGFAMPHIVYAHYFLVPAALQTEVKTVAILADNVSPLNDYAAEFLRQNDFSVFEIPSSKKLSEDEIWDFAESADAVIAGMEHYNAQTLARLPKLKLIARRGVGVDAVDLEACTRHGIVVTRTVGAVEGAVAELSLTFILNFAREIKANNEALHAHNWKKTISDGTYGKTVGIIGFGGIGQELARLCYALGMQIVYTSRHENKEAAKQFNASFVSLERLLTISDYVSINIPLNDETRGLIGKHEINLMKPSAVLINTARGAIVDENALAKALKLRQLRGAGIDVFTDEPCKNSPLFDCENAILTPHTGTFTKETFIKMNNMAAESIVRFFRGKRDNTQA